MRGGIRKTLVIIIFAFIGLISPISSNCQSNNNIDNGLFFRANLGFNYFFGDIASQENGFFLIGFLQVQILDLDLEQKKFFLRNFQAD